MVAPRAQHNRVTLTVKKGITDTFHFLWRTLGIRFQALNQCVQQASSTFLPHAPESVRERDEDCSHIGRNGYGIAILSVRSVHQFEV